ncbi:pyridoxal-phosphate dependent enzyme [Gammaproteobacteria bacterium]|nr:pyridoxal-phosphate dependent enzyme [Gammaproteobacteria bacterium]
MDIPKFVESYFSENYVQKIEDPTFKQKGVSVSILRCDLIHPELSGNKWFKLKYNLLAANQAGCKTLLSFGGAWSNHIHALAASGKLFGFKTIGVIRGEIAELSKSNACLADASANGMLLHAVTRAEYRYKESTEFIEDLHKQFGDFFLIPEGGANLEGIKGCAEILQLFQSEAFDKICLACGTGTTLAGLLTATKSDVLGFQVLKGEHYLQQQVNGLLAHYALSAKADWSILDNYHCGGYAKTTPVLLEFINSFQQQTGIPLEPIYSGKMLYGIYALIQQGFFPEGSRILAIHGGGLQGRRGFS